MGRTAPPHATGPAGDAIEECLGLVGGPKARQLCTVGGCEGVADLGGQLGELRGGSGRQALGREGAQFGELDMQEALACEGCASWCGEGVQMGGLFRMICAALLGCWMPDCVCRLTATLLSCQDSSTPARVHF
jgi:hypothetical protein